ISREDNGSCTLLTGSSATVAELPGVGPLVPNAGGAGYYRFRLDHTGWDRLIAAAATLSSREALSVADSLWADFAAGSAAFDQVIAAARSLSFHAERLPVIELGYRLKGLADTVLTPDEVPEYRHLMRAIYGSPLAVLGVDLRPGA